ncbi:MAG: hypothetical protein M3217_05200, partial [Actinomycetota bacterium]|nr:hypothetical protein [Actinomycetota bacterium]
MTSPVSATFLFADIAGFTALTEAHGDEQAAELVSEFCAAVSAALPTSGGSHVKTIGDALMLTVPDPAAGGPAGVAHHERPDARARRARRARRPASRTRRRALRRLLGAAVNLAARLAGEAMGGEVLLTA